MSSKGGVYIITNTVTSECYVGSTCDIKARWIQHKGFLRRGNHQSMKLQQAWNTYREEAFTFGTLEVVSIGWKRLEREQAWIDKLQPTYNAVRARAITYSQPDSQYIEQEDVTQESATPPLLNINLLSPDDIARILKVNRRLVLRLIHSKEIVAFKIGREWRVLLTDFKTFIKQNTEGRIVS